MIHCYPSEDAIHLAVMEWVNLHPSISPYVIHIPNEGKRSFSFGKKLKKMGMRAGVYDLFIAIPKNGYHGMWLELKSRKGKLSKEQLQFCEDMGKQDYFPYVVYTIDDAIEIIKEYCGI
jgi:hypothetical protein